ncbi:hypothetical protein BJ322DRAFT_1002767 [Thelephora terrestris]|uniref:Tethering factor for nuclear proteasome STS1 n=1 Tax=Thelephora terrestris TaxID=56493 RepID=A0A9P6L811_9AGAM|nr:hypothetical protein BJ322DRAFT_1002767 [Thelephora terrestris]
MASWGHVVHPPSVNHQLPATRVQKRRLEQEDEDAEPRLDIVMERTPTPERPKRAPPKRARRADPSGSDGSQSTQVVKGGGSSENEVDIGVLLATLPPQSLLPILTALIESQPSLKPTVLSLIPRPSVESAVQALAQSAKKLRDAYPYSNTSSFSATPSASFGFGTLLNPRSSTFGAMPSSAGFGRASQFGTTSSSTSHGSNGMRDEYIVSRLRPHISDYVSACFSYLPYFSYVPSSNPHHQQSQAKSHPSETFVILSAVTSQILSQPPLTQDSLIPFILPRLQQEWNAWVERLDEVVNRQAGMFGGETVNSWERTLDELAEAKGNGLEIFRQIRDTWVAKVGWLVGRKLEHRIFS